MKYASDVMLWIADDGRGFETEEACERHERNAESTTTAPSAEGEFGWSDLHRHWIKSEAEEKDEPARQVLPMERAHLSSFAFATNELMRLGWRPMRDCPKNVTVRFIGMGSAGVCPGRLEDTGRAFAFEAGDLWPIQPVLWKEMI